MYKNIKMYIYLYIMYILYIQDILYDYITNYFNYVWEKHFQIAYPVMISCTYRYYDYLQWSSDHIFQTVGVDEKVTDLVYTIIWIQLFVRFTICVEGQWTVIFSLSDGMISTP